MPYLKYGDWYIPDCEIAFPTESEAWEYIQSQSNQVTPLLNCNAKPNKYQAHKRNMGFF